MDFRSVGSTDSLGNGRRAHRRQEYIFPRASPQPPDPPDRGHSLGLPSNAYFAAFERALLPAYRGEVDLVVHGGDILYRSKVKPGLVLDAFAPLKRVADGGVPVVLVPGNHERSAIPYPLLAAHPGVHIIDRPRTVSLEVRGMRVAVSGFPNDRDRIRESFARLLELTEWKSHSPDLRLLAVHQTVEGASVGPVGFTFRSAPDVIPGRAIPSGFAAVLAGHIATRS